MSTNSVSNTNNTFTFGRITLLLSVLIALSAALTIRAEFAESQAQIYIFKALTMLMIITVAAMVKDPPLPRYKVMIIAGLAFSLAGDILLASPADLFVPGLVAFLIAQVIYSVAFTQIGGFYRSVLGAVPFLLYGSLVLIYLLSDLGDMKIPVLLYIIVIMFMIYQALGQYARTKESRALFALVGAALFVISDSVLAINRFSNPLEFARLYVLSTYFAAQWLIALSAGWKHP